MWDDYKSIKQFIHCFNLQEKKYCKFVIEILTQLLFYFLDSIILARNFDIIIIQYCCLDLINFNYANVGIGLVYCKVRNGPRTWPSIRKYAQLRTH